MKRPSWLPSYRYVGSGHCQEWYKWFLSYPEVYLLVAALKERRDDRHEACWDVLPLRDVVVKGKLVDWEDEDELDEVVIGGEVVKYTIGLVSEAEVRGLIGNLERSFTVQVPSGRRKIRL